MSRSASSAARQTTSDSPRKPEPEVQRLGLTILHPTTKSNQTVTPVADVVFVHGMGGHPRNSWSHRDNKTFWPGQLLPADQSNLRIMTYGYGSAPTRGYFQPANKMNISDHGSLFLNALAPERDDCPERPIIFVGHSLGGIIVVEALVQSRDSPHPHLKGILDSTRGLIFFGVPLRGAAVAGLAEILRRLASAMLMDTARPILTDLNPKSGSAKLPDLCRALCRMLASGRIQPWSFDEAYIDLRLRRRVCDSK